MLQKELTLLCTRKIGGVGCHHSRRLFQNFEKRICVVRHGTETVISCSFIPRQNFCLNCSSSSFGIAKKSILTCRSSQISSLLTEIVVFFFYFSFSSIVWLAIFFTFHYHFGRIIHQCYFLFFCEKSGIKDGTLNDITWRHGQRKYVTPGAIF